MNKAILANLISAICAMLGIGIAIYQLTEQAILKEAQRGNIVEIGGKEYRFTVEEIKR